MKYTLIILFLFGATCLTAQSIQPSLISPTGMYQKDNANNTHLISIGEPAITTISNNTTIITQGFLQPYEIFFLDTNHDLAETITINVFPNPTSEFIRIDFSSLTANTIDLFITDNLGRLLYNNPVTVINGKSSLELNIKSWSAGTYFIKAVDQHQVLTAAFKFIKI